MAAPPAANVKPGSKYRAKPKATYSVEEVTALLKKTDAHKDGVFIRILLELGLRCSELCGLMWRDFDFDKKTVTIERACTAVNRKPFIGEPKNKSSVRTLPVSSALCERLKKYRSESKSEYVLVTGKSRTGLPITPCKFTGGRYKKFFEDMRIEKVLTPHECRHTCGLSARKFFRFAEKISFKGLTTTKDCDIMLLRLSVCVANVGSGKVKRYIL